MQDQQTASLFNSLRPVNGKLPGHNAKTYFLSSNLPAHCLRDIWERSDLDRDGQLTMQEFATALQLIQVMKRRVNEAALHSVRVVNGSQTTPANPDNWSKFSPGVMPGSASTANANTMTAASDTWIVDQNTKRRFLAHFNRLDTGRTGNLPGSVVRMEFLKTGLSTQTLKQIWSLSDITNSGSLSVDEFCVAMYLVENAQRGRDPPSVLTPSLIPPQYRKHTTSSGFSKVNFENKRQENFDRGEAELERRRVELKERERLQKEEKEAEAAAAAELQRQREMLEQRRQLEFQQQRTRSMEAEALKRAEETRNEEERARSRVESWASGRKQHLEGQLTKLRETTTGLRTRKLLLDKELSDMRGRTERLRGELARLEEERDGHHNQKNRLQLQRQQMMDEVGSARLAVQCSQKELSDISREKLRLSQSILARRDPGQVMLGIQQDQEKAKQSIVSLRREHEGIVTKSEGCQREKDQLESARMGAMQLITERDASYKEKEAELKWLQAAKEEQDRAAKAKAEEEKRKVEAERRRVEAEQRRAEEERKERERAEKQRLDAERREIEKQKIEAERRKRERAEIELREQQKLELREKEELRRRASEARVVQVMDGVISPAPLSPPLQVDLVQFNDLDSEITSPLEVRQRLATEAAARLQEMVRSERQRSTVEKEQFYASLPRNAAPPPREGYYMAPRAVSRPVQRAPSTHSPAVRRPAQRAPSTRSLICLSEPAAVVATPANKPDYAAELAEVLSPVLAREQPGPPVQPRNRQVSEETEWNEQEDSIYMNLDPTGEFQPPPSSISSIPRTTTVPSPAAAAVSVLLSSGSLPTQEDEHIYATTEELGLDPPQLEVIFQVEALSDHMGAPATDELSFKQGDRISIYEDRGGVYYGELAGKLGVVRSELVEKCEWIYGDLDTQRSPPTEVVALYDFESVVDGDLTFTAGDVITVVEVLGEWFRGHIGSRKGIFPGNFVTPHDPRYETSGNLAPPTSALPDQQVPPLWCGVMKDGFSSEKVQLTVGSDVNVLAEDGSNLYIETVSGERVWISTDLVRHKSAPIGAERIPASLHCFSLYPYRRQNEDELRLRESDIITITEQSDPNWWIGKLGSDVGLFPSNYVEIINDHLTWETVKTWSSRLSTNEDERTRQEAIHELITTEKTYIDDLLLVVEVFYNPLCTVATDEELSRVFVNWQQLILCNARLFRALYNTCDANSFETVGSVILELIDTLVPPYTKFCSCQRQAMVSLADGTSAAFKAKEAECANSPKVGKLPLSTFLLKPMQRITKYPLLIKKILEHTREGHPDGEALREALSRTEQLLVTVNEAVRATSRLETLQRALTRTTEELGERITLNSSTNCLGPRRLVHFGPVQKSKGGKEMFAALFTDMLWVARVEKGRYGSKPIDLDARDFDSIKFEAYKDPFLLTQISGLDPSRVEGAVVFNYGEKQHTLYCGGGGGSAHAEWVECLEGAVRNAQLMSRAMPATPDPTLPSEATLTIKVVEGLELSLPATEKATNLFVQASLRGQVQRTPSGSPKWDSTMHFLVRDCDSDKINVAVFKEFTFAPNMSLGKFDLSISKLLQSGNSGPWNKRLILTETNSGVINVTISLKHFGKG